MLNVIQGSAVIGTITENGSQSKPDYQNDTDQQIGL